MPRLTAPSLPVLGARGDSAGIMAAGLAAVIVWLWFPYRALIIAGAVVAVLGALSLAADLRRGRAWHEQDVMIRKLWADVKAIPSGVVLADPETGDLLTVERERGWLTLAVTDPPAPGTRAVVTRYPLGYAAAPSPPPLHRHMGALDDLPPARWRWRQRAGLELFAAQSGGLDVTAADLAGLAAQLRRAVLPDPG
jgi:hypothetical protein